MVTSSHQNTPLNLKDCRQKTLLEVQLVDEHGVPLANLPFTLINPAAANPQKRVVQTGKTNAKGKINYAADHDDSVLLQMAAQPLADEMEQRPLRTDRRHSSVKLTAQKQSAHHHYVYMGQLSDGVPMIEQWPENEPPPKPHFPKNTFDGYAITLGCKDKETHIIEVCPFRAWRMVLEHSDKYSLVNAHNLGFCANLAYATDKKDGHGKHLGSIEGFFFTQMQDITRLPFKTDGHYVLPPVLEDVPFSERYYDVQYLNSVGDGDELPKIGDTHMYYVVSKSELIISWRGTNSLDNILTDLNYLKQSFVTEQNHEDLPLSCIKNGKAHGGFYNAYRAIEDYPDENIRDDFIDILRELKKHKKLFISGHSLGGALSLIHASHLTAYKPCLYTYGMPRTLTRVGVEELGNKVIHFRHVNRYDLVASVPTAHDIGNGTFKATAFDFLKIVLAKSDSGKDPFSHHGELIYFYHPVLEMAESKMVSKDPKERRRKYLLTAKTKLMLFPKLWSMDLAEEYPDLDEADLKSIAHEEDGEKISVSAEFPSGHNPRKKRIQVSFDDHYMKPGYSSYLANQIYYYLGLHLEQNAMQSPFVKEKLTQNQDFQAALESHKNVLSAADFRFHERVLKLESAMQTHFKAIELSMAKKSQVTRFYEIFQKSRPFLNEVVQAEMATQQQALSDKLKEKTQQRRQNSYSQNKIPTHQEIKMIDITATEKQEYQKIKESIESLKKLEGSLTESAQGAQEWMSKL